MFCDKESDWIFWNNFLERDSCLYQVSIIDFFKRLILFSSSYFNHLSNKRYIFHGLSICKMFDSNYNSKKCCQSLDMWACKGLRITLNAISQEPFILLSERGFFRCLVHHDSVLLSPSGSASLTLVLKVYTNSVVFFPWLLHVTLRLLFLQDKYFSYWLSPVHQNLTSKGEFRWFWRLRLSFVERECIQHKILLQETFKHKFSQFFKQKKYQLCFIN